MTEENKGEMVQKGFKNEVMERRERIIELAKKVGLWNLDKKLLAKQFGISERMIYKDIKWIIGNIRPERLREIKVQLDLANRRALNEALLLLTNNNPEIKLRAINAIIAAQEAYTKHLENFGDKPRIANELSIDMAGNFDINSIIKTAQEAKEKRENAKNCT